MRIAVFLASSPGTPAHRALVAELAATLAGHGHTLVYGGARVGLMGLLADAALAAGGEVLGVIPQHLVDREVAHDGLTRLEVVASMHERKARMTELAEAFVTLPGGAGTLEELFEVYTWALLGLHDKPIALVDPDGFYDHLVAQLDRTVADGYLGAERPARLRTTADVLAWLTPTAGTPGTSSRGPAPS